MSVALKKLPIGIQTFEKLILENYLYVDKTQYLYHLLMGGSVYFLSRPRRFGKSLTISTLEAIFLGKKELFNGLWIEHVDYDWEIYPVLRFDFSKIKRDTPENLINGLQHRLQEITEQYGVSDVIHWERSPSECFDEIITQIGRIKKVVILIDEYDKPILDVITDNENALKNRDILKDFYTIIKAQDANIRFVLLTGVTKFSKVSVFSGLNNLQDLTMTHQAAALCGYTQEELETNFEERIKQLAESQHTTIPETLKKIKAWYNGYRMSTSGVMVYNPFSTLLLFQHREFKAHWFETGTPTFLVNLLKQNSDISIMDIKNRKVSESTFSTFDIESLSPIALLFQTGYLTIQDYQSDLDAYILGYPNQEVEKAFTDALLTGFSSLNITASSYVFELQDAFLKDDLDAAFKVLKLFFSNIPYDIQIKQEKYYQSIFYLIFTLLGFTIHAEVKTNKGRIDAVVETDQAVYIFEFKLNDTAQAALVQIKTLDYAEKYQQKHRIPHKKVHLVGVGFDSQKREITDWITASI